MKNSEEALIEIGRIGKTHGLDGEVYLIFAFPINQEELKKIRFLFIGKEKQHIPYFIKHLSYGNQKATVQLEDVNNIDEAKRLVGLQVFVPELELPFISEDKSQFREYVGYKIIDKLQGELGVIQDIMDFPQQKIVRLFFKGKEVLFPLSKPILTKKDKHNKTLYVDLPDGLLDIYLK